MHEEVIVLVELASYVLRYTCGVWDCRYSGVAYERIDLPSFPAEQVHELDEGYSADGGDYE